ncbi:2-aminoethylphosphonate aminotransferase [Bacillus benzoevorans]|uniref:2-aminoethylphosphonate--pyruvate transaminase n=1 Tax=Bacillus benzoevorans TaxID=1456 RepID=A0A7X0HR60_9BACI|nr:2-aminoethylphosphonate--pyruvate transaminase [Bacillus benzoevorans]MBB6445384.1 2-aminoethylphosphonate-pyruvate transaminase [Bacillus benzoevorans]
MIKTAVILAAGMGSRLGNLTAERPKGFLLLDHLPIIEHSLKKLFKSGIEKIIIGTGYCHEMYEELSERYPSVKCIYNAQYESSGSMQTLYALQDAIQEDFILLESDLIYEQKIMTEALEHGNRDVILASDFTNSGDEVWIEINDKGTLQRLSKNKAGMTRIFGEFVGITKLSYNTFMKMCRIAEMMFPEHPKMDYEQALVSAAIDVNLAVHTVNRLVWCEVDDEDHWQRAVEVIYPLIQAHEAAFSPVKRNILLNPGPATTTDSVKYAQIVPDICPRESEFSAVMQYIATELTQFVGSPKEFAAVLFAGSGTAAVEAIISSVIEDKALFIIHNGAYGRRICEMAENYSLPYIEYASPYDKAIDLKRLEEYIQISAENISHLAVVHNETTTGLLNPLDKIGAICGRYGIKMIVDAMSSFAAVPIDMKNMNISYLAASANKNLQGMAGVSFVIANKEELMSTQSIRPRNLYLHLYSQFDHFSRTKQMRYTPPVQILYALKQAIIETKWEGLAARYKRYCEIWEVLINGITRLGLRTLVDLADHSKIITAIIEPQIRGYHFTEMHDYFFERGFTIYPGKFAGLNTFRIANIGAITKHDMENFIVLLEEYIGKIVKE